MSSPEYLPPISSENPFDTGSGTVIDPDLVNGTFVPTAPYDHIPEAASSEPLDRSIVSPRKLSVLGIRKALTQRKLEKTGNQIDQAEEPNPDAEFYKTMAEDILAQSGFQRTDDGSFEKTTPTEYDPMVRFTKSHRTKRSSEFGEPPTELPDSARSARTITQVGASRRRNGWMNQINEAQHIQHETRSLYGDIILDKENLKAFIAEGRYEFGQRRAMRGANKRVTKAGEKEDKLIERLVRTANGEDTFGKHHKRRSPSKDKLEEKQEKLEDKLEEIEKRHAKSTDKRSLSQAKSDVRKKERKTRSNEDRLAQKKRLLHSVQRREVFYEDLAGVTDRDSVGRDEAMSVKPGPVAKGGLRERAATARASWHKSRLDHFGETGHADGAQKEKAKLEKLGQTYQKRSGNVAKRRTETQQKVNRATRRTTARHSDLRIAKQRLVAAQHRIDSRP